MRRSTVFFIAIAAQAAIAILLMTHAISGRNASGPRLDQEIGLVSTLRLTDLCLFTEARYTRHPSMADRNTAFQDYPFSFEHFPSGSLMPVPEIVRK